MIPLIKSKCILRYLMLLYLSVRLCLHGLLLSRRTPTTPIRSRCRLARASTRRRTRSTVSTPSIDACSGSCPSQTTSRLRRRRRPVVASRNRWARSDRVSRVTSRTCHASPSMCERFLPMIACCWLDRTFVKSRVKCIMLGFSVLVLNTIHVF